MERRRLSRGEAAFMIGVPLAWAVLLLFRPSGEGDQVCENAPVSCAAENPSPSCIGTRNAANA